MEFALLVPLLLVLVFGIIDFGVAFAQNLSLNNGARDSARFAVVHQIDGSPTRTCYDALKRVRDDATGIGMNPLNVGVSVTVGGSQVCSVAAGTALPASANTVALQKAPCLGSISGSNDQLQVTATYSSSLIIPITGTATFSLAGNGYFRCEYSA